MAVKAADLESELIDGSANGYASELPADQRRAV